MIQIDRDKEPNENIIDKIRFDIEQKCCITVGRENEPAITLYDVLQIIEKYNISEHSKMTKGGEIMIYNLYKIRELCNKIVDEFHKKYDGRISTFDVGSQRCLFDVSVGYSNKTVIVRNTRIIDTPADILADELYNEVVSL